VEFQSEKWKRLVSEIFGCQTFERRTVGSKGTKYSFAVPDVCSYEDVEVFGRTWFRVNADCIAAYYQIFNALLVERE
jgi:hypothetical protein